MSRKRARLQSVRGKRPIDKDLITIDKAAVAGTQLTTSLKVTTFPCTIVGLRWTISCAQNAGTGDTQLFWAIIIVPDGDSVNAFGTGDSNTFYAPEQNVLTYGITVSSAVDNMPVQFEGSTKTMRKLKAGDVVLFATIAQATDTWMLQGVVQFFCKS